MKILVTGAHFTPAIATIEELKKFEDTKIIYVGRKTTLEGDNTPSVESRILPTLGVKFIPIITGRIQRAFTIYTIQSLLKIPVGFIQSFFIILSEKPDVILSFGGYVAIPIVIIGWLFSIPIIIHEQTLVSGLANKISSIFADKIAVSFAEKKSISEKVIYTGNPIRSEIVKISRSNFPKHKGLPVILVIGGNQGSHIINEALEGCLNELFKIADIYHQTGDSKFSDYERLSKIKNDHYKIFKFLSDGWEKILASADLVVSRAGINTLMELSLLSKPVLLIPIPYVSGGEQLKNAKFFEDLGLAEVLPQSKLSSNTLLQNIKDMLKNLNILKNNAKNTKSIAILDAAKRLALETILLAKHD